MQAIPIWITAGFLIFLQGWLFSYLVSCYLPRTKEKHAEKSATSDDLGDYRDGFTAGLNIGMRKFGQHLRAHHNPNIHGFAIVCHKCHWTIATFHDVRSEYIRCPHCKHRNPAPIPEEDTQQSNSQS